MDNQNLTIQTHLKWVLGIIIAFVIVRLISLGLYPLYDTTEARYGEMARLMVETQNWITPLFDYNVPFWGKPPMHTWASAISFQALGVSEFSARLPHFLAALATVFTLYRFAKHQFSSAVAHNASLILISCLGFIIAGGMVMTDAILTFAVTLAMTSFWLNFVNKDSIINGVLFFVALSIGMLVKGPVAVVIVGIALVTWSVANRCLLKAIKSLPWSLGLVVFFILTLPWYVLAESSTPGFLEYFLWGEHVQRFLESGWEGDLYGSAHDEVKGTIWLFWIAMTFPWSFVTFFFLFKKLRSGNPEQVEGQYNGLNNYLIAWLVAPMLLFTMAGNILPAYVLPGIPAFALWLAPKFKSALSVAKISIISFVILVSALVYIVGGYASKTSQVELIGNNEVAEGVTVYYWKKRPFSGMFYSGGKAKLLDEEERLYELLMSESSFLLAVRTKEVSQIVVNLESSCKLINTTTKHSLFNCN